MTNNHFNDFPSFQRTGDDLKPSPGRRGSYASRRPYAPAQPDRRTPYQDHDRYRRMTVKKDRPRHRLAGILAGVVIVAAVAAIVLFVQSLPATITFNGTELDVGGDKTVADALAASGADPKPGNLVAMDGSILEQGGGEPFHASVNGQDVTDHETRLASGDVVEVSDGSDVTEPSDTTQEAIPYTVDKQGTGAIHLVEGQGVDGLKTVEIGSISEQRIEQIEQEPTNLVRRNVIPDVGGDKVIALTFDDGPWPTYTSQILDVLDEYGVKATFFTVGNRISGDGVNLVKRACSAGHQICTHSFDHAAGSGQSVNLGYMTPEEQVAEIEKGYAAIEAVTGSPASHVVRVPGGNYGPDVVKNIGPLVDAEIGWNIDTRDWSRPGVSHIVAEIEKAWPGLIVLMHDGGGDRSQTVEALKTALPYLQKQGYRFITMDEMMSYPLK